MAIPHEHSPSSVSGPVPADVTANHHRQDAPTQYSIPQYDEAASSASARSPGVHETAASSEGKTFRLTVNHAMDEIINMRHMARHLQATLHTRLAVAQLCADTDIPTVDADAAGVLVGQACIFRSESRAEVPTCGGGLDLPLHIITDNQAHETYNPASAATRYSQILEQGILSPELNLWTRMLAGTPDAYDFNSLAADAGVLNVRDVAVQGLKWKYRLPARDGEEVRGVKASGMLSGSVMPRVGVGKTIICEYPRPVTQPTFIRYITSQPFSRMIIVNLSPAVEENIPQSARPPYHHFITHTPVDLCDVLHDNTISPAARQEWANIHAEWRRYTHNHEANDAVRGAALNKAREQSRTVAFEEGSGNGDEGARRATKKVLEDCNMVALEGYITQMPVLHLQITDEAGAKDWKDDKVAAMRLILRYLLPGYKDSVTFGSDATPSNDTGMMLISQGKHDRAGGLYVALRYLDSIIHSLDPLSISHLSPSLPSDHIDTLPNFHWHTANPSSSTTITPTAPRKPIVVPKWIQTLTPHLIPMIRLIDQTAEYRNYTTTEKDRRGLYDIVEIVMMYGLEGLVQADKWQEQMKSMYTKGEVKDAEGGAFKRWRSVWKEERVYEGDKETVKRAQAAIRTLERDARGR